MTRGMALQKLIVAKCNELQTLKKFISMFHFNVDFLALSAEDCAIRSECGWFANEISHFCSALKTRWNSNRIADGNSE